MSYFTETFNFILNESKDKSELSSSFKQKTGKSFEYFDLHSSQAKKYLDSIPNGDKRWIKTANGEVVIDTEKDKLAGYSLIHKQGIISPIWVLKPYRGYGLGKKLLDDAVKKYHGDNLGVNEDNKVAIKMYEKYGFREFDRDVHKNGTDMIYMGIGKKYMKE